MGRQIHLGSLSSLGYFLGVGGFIRGRWIHWGAVACAFGTTLMVSDSLGVAGFNGVHRGSRRIRPGSQGSLVCALNVVGFIRGR